MFDVLSRLWRQNPVRAATLLAAGVVFVCSVFGVVVDQQSVVKVLLELAPFVLASEAARGHVRPVAKLVTNPKTLPPDAVNLKDWEA